MSKEIIYYSNVKAETAYIAGIVEASVTPIDILLSAKHCGIDTDIFWLGDKGIDSLYAAILHRLSKYNQIDKLELNLEQDPFMPNIPIKKIEDNSTAKAISRILLEYSKSDKMLPKTKDFFFTLNWYLGQPLALYRTDMKVLYEYMPELEEALRAFYLYIISELVFVEYKGYVLMLVIGSNE